MSENLPVNYVFRIVVNDFSNQSRTIVTPLDRGDDVAGCVNLDLVFFVGAPLAHEFSGSAEFVFYIDESPVVREKSNKQLQVIYGGGGFLRESFRGWSLSVVEFFRLMFFRLGMASVDYADFLTVAFDSESKRVVFEKLPLSEYKLSGDQNHAEKSYRTLFGCVAGEVGMSVKAFYELTEEIERRNSECVISKLAMTVAEYEAPMLMLFGELLSE